MSRWARWTGRDNVYIAFQFIDYEQQKTGFQIKDNDLDKLKAVTIYDSLEAYGPWCATGA